MPVRIRLAISSISSGIELVVKALVNTGFTSETPDIAIPISIAERLGLWPKPREVLSVSLETGGGVVESYIVLQILNLKSLCY